MAHDARFNRPASDPSLTSREAPLLSEEVKNPSRPKVAEEASSPAVATQAASAADERREIQQDRLDDILEDAEQDH